MKGHFDENEWRRIINLINDCGISYFPCTTALIIGYLLSILTCCISVCLPMVCACDMVDQIRSRVKELNNTRFKPRGLTLSFRVKFLRTSWFEIRSNSTSSTPYETEILGDTSLRALT